MGSRVVAVYPDEQRHREGSATIKKRDLLRSESDSARPRSRARTDQPTKLSAITKQHNSTSRIGSRKDASQLSNELIAEEQFTSQEVNVPPEGKVY